VRDLFFIFLFLFLGAGPFRSAQADEVLPRPVELKTRDGWTLSATFHGTGDPASPACILLHDLGHDRGDWTKVTGAIRDAGFAVLTPDLRGHGRSTIRRGEEHRWTEFAGTDFRAMTQDVQAAVDFLREAEEGGERRIFLIGAGYGGNLALAFGGESASIAGCALLSPGLELRGLSLIGALRGYRSGPVLIACGGRHDRLGSEAVEKVGRLHRADLQTLTLSGGHKGAALVGEDDKGKSRLLDWLNGEREESGK